MVNEPLTISRYRLTGELGRGGMGVVYRADDPQLGRQVAVKVILFPPNAGPDLREKFEQRFEREARAAAGIRHPGVITVHDFGRDGDYLFLVMELIDGLSLAARLASGWRPGRAEALEIAARVAEALGAAHAVGVVHRDVTPHNILLAEDGRIVVTDFGVARSLGEETIELTRTGMLVGSPDYMSPELVRGRDFDGRADLFSLGVVLFRLLTGQRAFQSRDVTSLLYQIVHENPLEDTAARATLDPDVRRFLERCLAKSPDDRIPDARTFAEEARRLALSLGDRPASDVGAGDVGAGDVRAGDVGPRSLAFGEAETTRTGETLYQPRPRQPQSRQPRQPPQGRRTGGRALMVFAVVLALAATGFLARYMTAERPDNVEPGVETSMASTDPGADVTALKDLDSPTTEEPDRLLADREEANREAESSSPEPSSLVDESESAPPASEDPTPVEVSPPPPSIRQPPPPSAEVVSPAARDRRPERVPADPVETSISETVSDLPAQTPSAALDSVAPVLAIDAQPDEWKASEMTLTGRVLDDRGDVELSLDGERLDVEDGGEFSIVRKLQPGRNVFTFVAVDEAGNQTLRAIEVTSTALAATSREESAAGGQPAAANTRPRFHDRGDGTVVDTMTGLTWTKRPTGEGLAFKAARNYCRKLDLGRQRDWRLPTIEELEELYSAGSGSSRSNSLNFPEIAIWSTSKKGFSAAWSFDFAAGRRAEFPTGESSAQALCVRRPAPDGRPPHRLGPNQQPFPGDPGRGPRPGGGG